MISSGRRLPGGQIAMILFAALLLAAFLKPENVKAQRGAPPTADAYLLPERFFPGSAWRFTTWTVPDNLTYTVIVQRTYGGWALLKRTDTPDARPRWYYVPQMTGSWEPQ
jgi:hypothetical protein